MKALEFKSKIKENQISIPKKLQSELNTNRHKNVRVIVLVDETEVIEEDEFFEETIQDQFLKGYADSDSIYDNC